jgi:hypothetical protein
VLVLTVLQGGVSICTSGAGACDGHWLRTGPRGMITAAFDFVVNNFDPQSQIDAVLRSGLAVGDDHMARAIECTLGAPDCLRSG